MASSDYPISELSDPFAVDIISNSLPLSTKNEVSEKVDPFEHLELSPNKRYALQRRDTVEYWNPWWRQVLNSSKTDDRFSYFSWTRAKKSVVWEYFKQGANIQNDSSKALCKICWKIFTHPKLWTSSSSTSTFRRHIEYKKCDGSKDGQSLLLQFRVSEQF